MPKTSYVSVLMCGGGILKRSPLERVGASESGKYWQRKEVISKTLPLRVEVMVRKKYWQRKEASWKSPLERLVNYIGRRKFRARKEDRDGVYHWRGWVCETRWVKYWRGQQCVINKQRISEWKVVLSCQVEKLSLLDTGGRISSCCLDLTY